jgi:hypothetical protein
MYSENTDRVFWFRCLCSDQVSRISLVNDGFDNWAHLPTALKSHESSGRHMKFYQDWIEAGSRPKGGNTIGKLQQLVIHT